MRIKIGISTCPNDTFAFFPLLERRLATDGFELDFCLLDVQELNERLQAGALDVGKASFHAALKLAERYAVFSAGSALGFGNGPLLLASPNTAVDVGPRGSEDSGPSGGSVANQVASQPVVAGRAVPPGSAARVWCPGQDTTAHMLYRLFYGERGQVQQAVFSEIAPALLDGRADYGVCIHEGRFTYQQQGLRLVEDLGERWERETNAPLPLGGILGRRDLGAETLSRLGRLIEASVRMALGQRGEALSTMQRYAQEFSPEVLWAHVDLYVNRWTERLGAEGERALAILAERAVALGLVPPGTRLDVVSPD
jgi:1,4-dihydroxy-6-naphthoate synthase